MADSASRFTELINIVLDLIGRHHTTGYGMWGPDFWLVDCPPSNSNYYKILTAADFTFYDSVLEYIASHFSNYTNEAAMQRALLGARSNELDIAVGQWALDEWFYFYINASGIYNSLGYDLSNLQNLNGLCNGKYFWQDTIWLWDAEDD